MTRNPSTEDQPARVAIIGAGMTGLTAAHALVRSGLDVRVLDKGRGPGGRMASKRLASTTADHGAQYFTARDSRFKQQVARWVEDGVVDQWRGRLGVVSAGRPVPLADESVKRYVGVPRMSALTRHLSSGLNVTTGCRVQRISPAPGVGWMLQDDSGSNIGVFDYVILTVPPEQAVDLLQSIPQLAARVSDVRMLPCWSVVLRFAEPLSVSFDGIFAARGVGSHQTGLVPETDLPLGWVARNSSKPGRPADECWVAHASPSWSRANLEVDRAEVQQRLTSAFFDLVGLDHTTPVETIAHRWRYAKCENPRPDGCMWDPDLGIGVAGDWCQGANVEAAYLSGLAIAEALSQTVRASRNTQAQSAQQSGSD